jgi:hypothetical protein
MGASWVRHAYWNMRRCPDKDHDSVCLFEGAQGVLMRRVWLIGLPYVADKMTVHGMLATC